MLPGVEKEKTYHTPKVVGSGTEGRNGCSKKVGDLMGEGSSTIKGLIKGTAIWVKTKVTEGRLGSMKETEPNVETEPSNQ